MLVWPKKLIVIPTNNDMMEVYTCVLNHYGIFPINIKDVEPEFDIKNYKNAKEAAVAMHISHDASVIVDITKIEDDTTSESDGKSTMITDLLFIDEVSAIRHFRSSVPGKYAKSAKCRIHKCIEKFTPQNMWCDKYDDYYTASNTSIGASIVKLMKALIDDHLLKNNEFFAQMNECNPLSTIVNSMEYKPLAHTSIRLAIIRNPEFQRGDDEEKRFSNVDVIVDTNVKYDRGRKYVYMMKGSEYANQSKAGVGYESGPDGFADYLFDHIPIIGDLYPKGAYSFDFKGYTDCKEDGGYHVYFHQYLNFGHYEYDQTLQCFFDMMTHVITDPGIKRLLTFQLKRLGISHVESETYAGKLIFSALNNSNK